MLTGVPGIGKSRLVFELFQTIETGDFGLVFWRHGRSLPYGEGVTFWALGEMVKAQAGILESDGPEQAGEKLRQAVARFVDDPASAAWLERQLRPLAGLETEEAGPGQARGSLRRVAPLPRSNRRRAATRPCLRRSALGRRCATGLRRLPRRLGERRASARARNRPPRAPPRQPAWGGGKSNSSTILLSALSGDETAALLHALLGSSVVDADLQARLLEHAGGNPLYAEEFTRMLTSAPDDVVLPETVQGIIAARLDTLSAEEKELLQDAAAMGRTFWLGALGGEDGCSRSGSIHSSATSSSAGSDDRRSPARRSTLSAMRSSAKLLTSRSPGRSAPTSIVQLPIGSSRSAESRNSELLAHHYAAALDYARASGQDTGPWRSRDGSRSERRVIAPSRSTHSLQLRALTRLRSSPGRTTTRSGRSSLSSSPVRTAPRGRGTHQSLEDAYEAALAAGRPELAAEADALLAELFCTEPTESAHQTISSGRLPP